jgi:hypothetical protein
VRRLQTQCRTIGITPCRTRIALREQLAPLRDCQMLFTKTYLRERRLDSLGGQPIPAGMLLIMRSAVCTSAGVQGSRRSIIMGLLSVLGSSLGVATDWS